MKNITQNIIRYLTILFTATGFAGNAIAQDIAQNVETLPNTTENTQNTQNT